MSVVFYGEPITSALIVGGGLILAAMVVSQLR
jgi:drug/metabolite transporter (DMT)-like permease